MSSRDLQGLVISLPDWSATEPATTASSSASRRRTLSTSTFSAHNGLEADPIPLQKRTEGSAPAPADPMAVTERHNAAPKRRAIRGKYSLPSRLCTHCIAHISSSIVIPTSITPQYPSSSTRRMRSSSKSSSLGTRPSTRRPRSCLFWTSDNVNMVSRASVS